MNFPKNLAEVEVFRQNELVHVKGEEQLVSPASSLGIPRSLRTPTPAQRAGALHGTDARRKKRWTRDFWINLTEWRKSDGAIVFTEWK